MKDKNGSNYKYVHKSGDVVMIITALLEEQATEILKNVAINPDIWRLDEVDDLEEAK